MDGSRGSIDYKVWYYRSGMSRARVLIPVSTPRGSTRRVRAFRGGAGDGLAVVRRRCLPRPGPPANVGSDPAARRALAGHSPAGVFAARDRRFRLSRPPINRTRTSKRWRPRTDWRSATARSTWEFEDGLRSRSRRSSCHGCSGSPNALLGGAARLHRRATRGPRRARRCSPSPPSTKWASRTSRTHAVIAGLVAATWFEFVYFAFRPLSESLALRRSDPRAGDGVATRRRTLDRRRLDWPDRILSRPDGGVAFAIGRWRRCSQRSTSVARPGARVPSGSHWAPRADSRVWRDGLADLGRPFHSYAQAIWVNARRGTLERLRRPPGRLVRRPHRRAMELCGRRSSLALAGAARARVRSCGWASRPPSSSATSSFPTRDTGLPFRRSSPVLSSSRRWRRRECGEVGEATDGRPPPPLFSRRSRSWAWLAASASLSVRRPHFRPTGCESAQ